MLVKLCPQFAPNKKSLFYPLPAIAGFCFTKKQLTAPHGRDKIKTQQGTTLKTVSPCND